MAASSLPFFPSQQESDNYDELGEKVDSLPLNFENLGRTEHFSGPAETVRVDEDNQLLKELMKQLERVASWWLMVKRKSPAR
ncbi:hypothetical protein [Corynebacterium stationis]|uniref:hypothetical protein n=1 Tax=Corynebacterium stationis TaxID=1705 RepID=UPI000A86D781|nr:hypothetical protein [Corynebacterium stationis]HJG63309.1 hypothetical protein [Corynebacterium stationis]